MLVFLFTVCESTAMNCTGTYEESLSILLEENKNTEPFSEGGTEIDIGNHTLAECFSATGNTKAVAETIAKATDGALFELTPVDLYTVEDLVWTSEDSRVNTEHNDESNKLLKIYITMKNV